MLVWRLNLAWKIGHTNQCLRLGDDAKTDRTFRARLRGCPSCSRWRLIVVAAGGDCGLHPIAHHNPLMMHECVVCCLPRRSPATAGRRRVAAVYLSRRSAAEADDRRLLL